MGLTELTHMATGEFHVPCTVSGLGGRSQFQSQFFSAQALFRFSETGGDVPGVSTLGSRGAMNCYGVSPGHHEMGCLLRPPRLQPLPSSFWKKVASW